MSVAKKEINYELLEKNLNEYEPITDERIKNFIIENKNLYPFLKEVYPIIKEFFPNDKLILEYVEDYEYPDWITLFINIKEDKDESIAEERVKIHRKLFHETIAIERKYNVISLVNISLF